MPLDTAPLLPPFGTVHPPLLSSVFFTDPPTPAIYTLSLHDALPILRVRGPRGLRRGATARRLEPRSLVDRSDACVLLPRLRERHVPDAPRETDPRVIHGRAQGAVRIPARPIRAVVRGPREGSGGAREGSGEGTGERKAVRHAMIANAPPDSLREFVLLRDSMAGPFRSLTSIGPADHGKEVSLAGWAEDVRNLGGLAFLIVRQRAGTFQITVKKGDAELFNRASKIVRE